MNAEHLVHLRPFPAAGQIATAIIQHFLVLRSSVNIRNDLNIGAANNAITRHFIVSSKGSQVKPKSLGFDRSESYID